MDIDDIPELDSTLPDPDFFDAEGPGPGGDLAQPAVPLPEALPLSNVMSNLGAVLGDGIELKFDDELCEFNEFLVGLQGGPSNATVSNNLGTEPMEDDGNKSQTSVDSQDTVVVELNNAQDVREQLESSTEEANVVSNVNGKIPRSNASSRSNTPVSRSESTAGAAVVRLSLPKVTIQSKRISLTRESTEKVKDKDDSSSDAVKSPPRMTRGRLNPPAIKESRPKRRLSDDSDDDDWAPSQSNTTRSGRHTRKAPRYGFDDNSDEDEDVTSSTVKAPPSDGESDLFEPVRKRRRTTYNIADDGTVYYTDSSGTTHIIKKSYVRVVRMELEDKNYQATPQTEEDVSPSPNPVLMEVCVDNIMSVREAVKGGAKRIELCSSLAEGGLTPTCGFLKLVKESFKDIPVFVMIRPRNGDFLYDEDEIEIMNRDISYYKQIGADGFVFGVLTKDSQVDVSNCKLLFQAAQPLPCTFHRAFDKVSCAYKALETIISIGFSRILTSGQQPTAHAGASTIKKLIEEAKGRIVIMPGCGINEKNVQEIVKKTGAKEIHGSASKSVASLMSIPGTSKSSKRGSKAKQSAVKMGASDDSIIKVTDAGIVAQMIRRAGRAFK